MKRIAFVAMLCWTASAQIVVIQPTDQVNASRTVINSNFSFLDGKQLSGSGAPSAGLCTSASVGRLYLRTDAASANSTFFICANTAPLAYTWEGTSLSNAVLTTGAYANPAWITSLDWSKIINAPVLNFTVQSNGASVTQRSLLNFGTNLTVVDNAPQSRTEINLSGTIASNTSGNATTATGFQSVPSQCSAGTYTRGVDVFGNAQNCTAAGAGTVTSVGISLPSYFQVVGSPVTGLGTLAVSASPGQTANQFLATPSGSVGALGMRAITSLDIPASIAASTSGNAATATALASTPGQCAAGTFSTGVTVAGTANCSTIFYQTVQANGSPVVQRTKVNLAAGSNMTITASDNGTDTTTLTLASSGAGGATTPGGSSNSVQLNSAGSFAGTTLNASGTKQYLSQTSSGTPVFAQVAAGDVSGLAASATTDTTSATNISAGTLAVARLPAAAVQAYIIANAGTTGTTVNTLTKLTGAPSAAVKSATTDTAGIIGVTISGAGTTSSATIAFAGAVSCVFDGGTTAGDYVGISVTVAGDCHDAGAVRPSTGQIVGRVLTTNGGGGTFTVNLFNNEEPGLAASATTDTTSATNISSGTLAGARLPATAVQTNQSNAFTTGTQDASAAAHTLPVKKGLLSAIPGTCTVGEEYFATDAVAGNNKYLCTATNVFTAQTGSGGTGASSVSQLTDFGITRTSSTLLTVNVAPSRFAFGTQVYTLSSNATATIAAGTGTVYFYLTSSGLMDAGSTLSVTCNANCTYVAGITSFPINTIALGTWHVTAGTWDAAGAGYTDLRSMLNVKPVTCGTAMICTDSGASTQVSVDTSALSGGSSGTSVDKQFRVGVVGTLPGSSLNLPSANAPSVQPGVGTNTIIGYWEFANGSSQSMYGDITLPSTPPTSLTFEFYMRTADNTVGHNISTTVNYACANTGNDPTLTTFGSATTAVPGTASQWVLVTITNSSPGCAGKDRLYFQVVEAGTSVTSPVDIEGVWLHN